MAQYIKFRLTAAKVGVSMALMALIAGIAEKVQTASAHIQAGPAADVRATTAVKIDFLKLGGISGGVKNAFVTLEDKWIKLDNKFIKLTNELTLNYNKVISDISSNFIKLTDDITQSVGGLQNELLTSFYSKQQTDSTFLKVIDADQDFVQGHGNVVSGLATVAQPNQSAPLLSTPDGAITVEFGLNSDRTPVLTITNGTNNALPAVEDMSEQPVGAGTSESMSSQALQPGRNPISLGGNLTQLHLQIFPSVGFGQVVTLTVSVEPAPSGGGFLAVGQLLTGGT